MAEATTDTAASNKGNQAVPLHERAEFIAWLTASCHAQHVSLTVTDPAVIERVAMLLGVTRPQRAAGHTRQTGRTRSMSKLREPGVPGAITA